jgi:hypothetical protein
MQALLDADSESRESLLARAWRLFWLSVLVTTVLLSAAWWLFAPGGFAVDHPRFWANSVAPIASLAAALGGLAALRRGSRAALRWLLPVWPAAWLGGSIAGRSLFPITLEQIWLMPLAGAVVMGLAALPLWRGTFKRALTGGLSLTVFVAVCAGGLVWTQYPPVPRTRPSREDFVEVSPAPTTRTTLEAGGIRLGRNSIVYSSEGSLMVRLRPLSVRVKPLLTFLSGSQDGCWSILARPRDQIGPEPRLRLSRFEGEQSGVLSYDFAQQGPATLQVQAEPAAGSIVMEANTHLTRRVYSHLNAYCDFEVHGHRRLELDFSPCPGLPIEVRKFDYPTGRPARFAFVEKDRTFRVVEATSGEKGPFITLARGRLAPEEALSIVLRDQGREVGRIVLADWSAQADTTLSPTAGWGVPVNAIEFSLADDPASSLASIFVTLAATSVGRGWDCVAHNPGTYRNRIRIEPTEPSPPGQAARSDRDR